MTSLAPAPFRPFLGLPADVPVADRDQGLYRLAGTWHWVDDRRWKTMAGLMKREPHGEAADVFGRFDQLFNEWMRTMMLPFRSMPFAQWRETGDVIRVEEFQENGALVVRADLPGIDPDQDVEVTVSDGMLRIDAERRVEEKREEREEKGYLHQEVNYGSLSRSLPLPVGVNRADISATYRNGVLEIRVPAPRRETATKIAISRS
jgi:HSP20 family protein